jgi:hypothetical protein
VRCVGHEESAAAVPWRSKRPKLLRNLLRRMMASRLVVACLLAVVIFAVPCLSLSRIACNNVKQGMDVSGADSRCFYFFFVFFVVFPWLLAGAVRSQNSPDGLRNVKDKVSSPRRVGRVRILPIQARFSRDAGQVLQGVQRRWGL